MKGMSKMDILKYIVVFMLLATVLLIIEMLLHPNIDMATATYLLKADVKKVIKALVTKEKIRHIFDENFYVDMKTILQEYSAKGMDIDIIPFIDKGLPYLYFQIISAEKTNIEIVENIAELLKIKFRRYLFIKRLQWRNFIYYTIDSNRLSFYICYEEFEEDKEAFERKYNELLRLKSTIDFGYIIDEVLNCELSHVS